MKKVLLLMLIAAVMMGSGCMTLNILLPESESTLTAMPEKKEPLNTAEQGKVPEKSEEPEKSRQSLNAEYNLKIKASLKDGRETKETKRLFEEWLRESYGEYESRLTEELTQEEGYLFYYLESWTENDYCDVTSLTDEEMAHSAIGYFASANSDRCFKRYGFGYEEFDGYYSKVSLATVEAIAENVYGRECNIHDNPGGAGEEAGEGYLLYTLGDAPEIDVYPRRAYELDWQTRYIIFDSDNFFEETIYRDVTGIVVVRNDASVFGYNVIAARGYLWEK